MKIRYIYLLIIELIMAIGWVFCYRLVAHPPYNYEISSKFTSITDDMILLGVLFLFILPFLILRWSLALFSGLTLGAIYIIVVSFKLTYWDSLFVYSHLRLYFGFLLLIPSSSGLAVQIFNRYSFKNKGEAK